MISSPTLYVFLYLIQLLLLSLGLGILTLHQPRRLPIPRLPRFLIGFCTGPFVLGGWMLLLALILPGAPRWVFLLLPSTGAMTLIVLCGPRTLGRLIWDHKRTHRSTGNPWPVYLGYIGAALILTLVISRLLLNGQAPIIGHDALFYSGRALSFSEERNLSATTGIRDSADGVFRHDYHNFLFPAFLSHALITTGDNPLGYPYDQAARAAFQVTIIYMLLSVVALAGTTRTLGTGVLALILLLQVPQLEYISHLASRDAFRIIPLMLLATVLAGLSPPRLRHRLRVGTLLPPLILAFFSLVGHTVGGFVVVTMTLAWLIWAVLQKARWLNLILVTVAIGFGLFLGSLHYLDLYIETGHFRGDTLSLAGTSLENIQAQRREQRYEQYGTTSDATTFEHLAILLERDNYRLSIPGVLGAMLALVWWARFKQEKRTKSIPFVGLVVLATALPFFGVFDSQTYQLSIAFLRNIRYALHWYPFAAVCLAMVAGYWYHRLISSHRRQLRSLAVATLTVLTIAASISAYETIISEWRIARENTEEQLLETLQPIQATLEQMPSGQKLLLEDDRYNYYLDNQAIVMYTRPTWDIIRAKDETEVKKALDKLNIGAVVLDEEQIKGWWDQTPLFSYLNNPQNAWITRNGRFRVYKRLTEDQKRLVQDYLEQSEIYCEQGKHNQCLEAYEQALELHPGSWEMLTSETQEHLAQFLTTEAPRDLLMEFSDIATEGGITYLVTNTGQRAKSKGDLQLTEGPWVNSPALMIDETTQLAAPLDGIRLDQGSLSVWARLIGEGARYAYLVRINWESDISISYHYETHRWFVKYNGVELGNGETTPLIDDGWHHYLFTWQDGEQKFYIDGKSVLTGQVTASSRTAETFNIGWAGNSSIYHWAGSLAEFTTFKRALTPAEVMTLYQTRMANRSQ